MIGRICACPGRRAVLALASALFAAAVTGCESETTDEGGRSGGATVVARPSCLRELFASCGTDGQCRSRGSELYCYTSGARAESTTGAGCADAGRSEMRVTKPDGSLCFTFEVLGVVPQSACEHGDYFWRNPAGELIATGNFSSGSGSRVSITCAADGDSWSCDPMTCPDVVPLFGNRECELGDCP